MARSEAATVDAYLAELPPDRRGALDAVRSVVLDNLPAGYEEIMQFGMIGYVVPLSTLPKTYNGQPLQYAALASQKNYMSLYLNTVYGNAQVAKSFVAAYEANGKKLDMGKSCVRFKRLDDLPLDLIGKTIAATSVAEYVRYYEESRRGLAASTGAATAAREDDHATAL